MEYNFKDNYHSSVFSYNKVVLKPWHLSWDQWDFQHPGTVFKTSL